MDADAVAAHPQLKHNGGPEDWMLLDKNHFALDGRSCNKIGVGYTAFRHQSSLCDRIEGSCLNNQPKDFWEQGARHRLASVGTFSSRTDSSNQVQSTSSSVAIANTHSTPAHLHTCTPAHLHTASEMGTAGSPLPYAWLYPYDNIATVFDLLMSRQLDHVWHGSLMYRVI